MQIDSVLEKLNLLDKDGLFYLTEIRLQQFNIVSNRIKETLLKLQPDAIFCINNEPLILFFDNPQNLDLLEKQIWNFNQTPIVFIISGNQIQIKNGFSFVKNAGLNDLADSNNISDFDYFKLITGESWEKYKSKFDSRKRIDNYLLNNIESARSILINKGLDSNVANSLIGRVIFIRYLIDRKVELNKYEILSKAQFYEILKTKNSAYKLFKQLRDDFNGNLFPLEFFVNNTSVNEEDFVSDEHLKVVISLLNGDKLVSINRKAEIQLSFFDIYDFSIIPIEFVSNVYEKFIGRSNQADQGAYYTPLFLVDYIQKQTVTEYFNSNLEKYNCKVLDPACGSGVFLVETLRQIILQYRLVNPDYNESLDKYKQALKVLLTENIFGIDKDENAIKVAIFSLYITLLDYLEPSSIVGFQFPPLLGTNFFVSDFFDLNADYNNILQDKHFQFILGNPPWGKVEDSVKLYESYWREKEKAESATIKVTDKQISQVFLIRVKDFSFDESALIVTSKVLYNINAKDYRQYLLTKFKFRQVFELSSIAEKIFNVSNDASIEPAVVLFYSVAKETTSNNLVKHISIKPNYFFNTLKLLMIEKYDIKEIYQSYFIDYDWIWKTLVFGNILDFYFIKRLKGYKSIHSYISNKDEFIYGKGISVGGGDENPISEHQQIEVSLDSKNKALSAYNLRYSKNFTKSLEFVHRQRRIDLFKAPILLVGKGITTDYKAKAAISYRDVIFTDAVTSIKPLKSDTKFIRFLMAVFNSNLFSYFMLQTNSSLGIERKQAHDKEDKFAMPVIYDEKDLSFSDKISTLENIIAKRNDGEFIMNYQYDELDQEISELYNEIDSLLIKQYKLNSQEKSLLDYTLNISIPLRTYKRYDEIFRKLNCNDTILEDYAQVFLNHFGVIYNKNGFSFEIEIIHSNHTIAMYFRVIADNFNSTKRITWSQKGYKDLLSSFSKLSFQNIGQDLFIQKDIKGFEEDGFYIIKPNEYKSWHTALAYLDLSEFIEALHNSNSNIDG